MINRQSFVPIYIQIAHAIIQSIQDGEIAYGAKLPSERELAERHAISRLTARQAIDELVKRSIAYRIQGKGTFVARPKIREASGFISFSEEIRQRGFVPTSRILVQQVVTAQDAIAAKIQIEPKTEVFQLDRVRLANGQPVAVEYSFINLSFLPNLYLESFENQSLFDVMRHRFGIYPTWAEAEIEARLVSHQEAEWLAMAPNSAVLVAHRLTFTESFEVVEVVDSVYPGDRFPIYIGRQRIVSNPDEKQ